MEVRHHAAAGWCQVKATSRELFGDNSVMVTGSVSHAHTARHSSRAGTTDQHSQEARLFARCAGDADYDTEVYILVVYNSTASKSL